MTLSTLDDYFILLPALLICASDKKIKQGGVNSIWRLSHTMQLFSALRRGWARRGMSFINQNSYLPILYAHDNFKLLLDHICEPVVVISDNRRGKDMNTKWLLAFFFCFNLKASPVLFLAGVWLWLRGRHTWLLFGICVIERALGRSCLMS